MNAADLLAELRRRGVEVVIVGDRLRYRPKDVVPEELQAAIREHKPTLLALLSAEAPVDDLDAGRFGRWEHEQASHDGPPMAWYWLPIGPAGCWVCSTCRPSDRPLPIVQRNPADPAPKRPEKPMWTTEPRHCKGCGRGLPRGDGVRCCWCEMAIYHARVHEVNR